MAGWGTHLRCIREEGLIVGASPQWHGSAGGGTAVAGWSDGRERWQLSRGAAGRRRGTHGGDDWIGGEPYRRATRFSRWGMKRTSVARGAC
jgi:hypothetical protein